MISVKATQEFVRKVLSVDFKQKVSEATVKKVAAKILRGFRHLR